MTTQLTMIFSIHMAHINQWLAWALRTSSPNHTIYRPASINDSSVDLGFHISTVANHLQLTATIIAHPHQPQRSHTAPTKSLVIQRASERPARDPSPFPCRPRPPSFLLLYFREETWTASGHAFAGYHKVIDESVVCREARRTSTWRNWFLEKVVGKLLRGQGGTLCDN
jgi:hypothetical protein